MIHKIIAVLISIILLFIGMMLAQNANTNTQSNSNTSNTIRSERERNDELESQIACQYLTKTDAKLMLKNDVYVNGNLTSYIDKYYYCNYSAKDGKFKNPASVRLDIKVFGTKIQAETAISEKAKATLFIKTNSQNSNVGKYQKLKSIGALARIITIGDNSVHIYFQRKNVAFELSVLDLKYNKTTIKNLRLLAKKLQEISL